MAYRGSYNHNSYNHNSAHSTGANMRQENNFLERQNDGMVNELSQKVSALKKITIAIGDDVREQNRLLNEMDSDFDASRGLLGSTMRRLTVVAKAGGKNMLCYLVLFALVVFFIIYYISR